MQWFADSLSLFLVNCKLSTVGCGLSSRDTEHGSRASTMNEKKRLRVGILFGGRSGEHEVSLASAASVIRGLDPDRYEAVPIGITKEGHWLVGAGAQKMLPEVLKGGQRVMMTADPTDAALVRLDGSGGGQRLGVVFPVMHGTVGRDGRNPGFVAPAGVRVWGAGVVGW